MTLHGGLPIRGVPERMGQGLGGAILQEGGSGCGGDLSDDEEAASEAGADFLYLFTTPVASGPESNLRMLAMTL